MDPQSDTAGQSWQRIVEALERHHLGPAKGPGTPQAWNRYLCPVHEGDGQHHTPSLGVRYDPRQAKTIVRCFSGTRCDDAEVLGRIGLRVRDMFDRLPERARHGHNHSGNRSHSTQPARTPRQVFSRAEQAILAARFEFPTKPDLGAQIGQPETEATYVYKWPNGRVEGAVIRRRTPHEHGYAKSFYQRHWTGTEWQNTGFAPLPWHLDDVREALDTGRELYVCEGEKDVQRARRAGELATCNAMGAGKWTAEHARWLRGAARVIVVADRDKPGYRHAGQVAETLYGQVGEVRVLQARAGKDLSDHFDAGHTLDELEPVRYLDRPGFQQQRPTGSVENRGREPSAVDRRLSR
ncbi:toprim domain-containing protein [Nocardia salmonicida]|uniref:toprim domain-containing protein n=1 Tax=Nocardia salmonicida TaxID=53431 RepID=UPI002E2E8662|nr:toprim domain-containing protein [Nocardia salmonicida]